MPCLDDGRPFSHGGPFSYVIADVIACEQHLCPSCRTPMTRKLRLREAKSRSFGTMKALSYRQPLLLPKTSSLQTHLARGWQNSSLERA
ncbi:unnamed protein product [Durusdinium trenchii]|uniref:Uncharacterized protein n=1 Tax=Durusdinium trenchii TaxID=1381693 RepID=A0ABP0NEW0_9DINO